MRPGSVLWDTRRSIEDSGGWGVVLKDDGKFVGTCSVDASYAPEHARAELGYVLSREHWGERLMPEAVRAVRF